MNNVSRNLDEDTGPQFRGRISQIQHGHFSKRTQRYLKGIAKLRNGSVKFVKNTFGDGEIPHFNFDSNANHTDFDPP